MTDYELPEDRKTLGFRAVKRRQKAKAGRGFTDPPSVIDCMKDEWEGLNQALNELPEGEQAAMKDHFNELIEDQGELGDLLFGEWEDFKSTVDNMGGDELKKFTDEILEVKILEGNDD